MRDDGVVQVVQKYIDAVRRNDPSDLPLHPEVVGEFPLNTYRGAKSFISALEPFSRVVRKIDIVRLVAEGEHCVAILNIDTVVGLISFAEHIRVVDGQIVLVRGYYDPRPFLVTPTTEQQTRSGHNCFLYHHAKRRDEAMTVDFGVLVARPFDREGDVRCFETPAGEVARTVHFGPYDRLGDAHNAIHAWCAGNNRRIAQASWETYGDWNNDPALLETTIKYLLC